MPDPSTEEVRTTRYTGRVVGFLALATGLGAVAGVLWWLVVSLPAYQLDSQGRASVTERDLTRFFAGDAWFCLLGLVVGVGLGVFGLPTPARPRLAAGAGGGDRCRRGGSALLGGGLPARPGGVHSAAGARRPRGSVPIALTVRAKAALLFWPLCAVTPVLLASSLGKDSEDPAPMLPRRGAGGRRGLDLVTN